MQRNALRKEAIALVLFLLFTIGYPAAVDQAWLRYDPYVLPLVLLAAILLLLYWFFHSDYALKRFGSFGLNRRSFMTLTVFVIGGASLGAIIGLGYYGLLRISKTHIAALLAHDQPSKLPKEEPKSSENLREPPQSPAQKQLTAEEIAEAVAKRLPPYEKHAASDTVTATVTHAPPKSARSPTLDSPRLGMGPEAYKDISDEQVGQWAIEEADKIQELAERAMNSNMESPGARTWRFTNDFKDCCMQDLVDLRTEIRLRLGVSAKDPEEIQAWTILFPQTKYPQAQSDQINPMLARDYAVHLRKLGLRLKRRAVPRGEPLPLQFSITRIASDKPEFPQRIVATITTAKDINAGYVAVEHEGPIAGIACDFEDSKLVFSGRDVENKTLARLLGSKVGKLYVMQVGKTPFEHTKPIHVVAFGKEGFRITSVIFFEE